VAEELNSFFAPCPNIPAGGPVSPEEEAWLAATAAQLAKGDQTADGRLWQALEPRFRAMARRVIRRNGGDAAAWRDAQPWLLDDLTQEAYPLLRSAIARWEPSDPLFPHLQAEVGRGLRRAWTRLRGSRRVVLVAAGLPEQSMSFAEDADVLILLDEVVDRLRDAGVPEDGLVLLQRRVVTGESVRTAAASLGLARTTAQRRWELLLPLARALLNGTDLPLVRGGVTPADSGVDSTDHGQERTITDTRRDSADD